MVEHLITELTKPASIEEDMMNAEQTAPTCRECEKKHNKQTDNIGSIYTRYFSDGSRSDFCVIRKVPVNKPDWQPLTDTCGYMEFTPNVSAYKSVEEEKPTTKTVLQTYMKRHTGNLNEVQVDL